MKTILFIILLFFKAFCFGFFESQVNVFTGEFFEQSEDLSFPGQYNATLTRTYAPVERLSKKVAPEWQFNFPDIFEQEIPRKKIPSTFNCDILAKHDEQHRIEEVQFFTKGDHGLIDTWQISYETSACKIQSSTGNSVCYFFINKNALEKVEKNGVFHCSYLYLAHPTERKLLISSKKLANGDRLEIEYHFENRDSFNYGKVKKLSYFNQDETFPAQVCNFTYSIGKTEVFYSNGLQKNFTFNSANELLKIEEFADGAIFKTEQFFWHFGNLQCKATFNETHELLLCCLYSYDEHGNIIKETLAGHLSGYEKTPLVIQDGQLVSETETYSTSYTYSEQGLLLEEYEDSGKGKLYQYNEQGQLTASFLVHHKQIIERTFYTYDSNCCMIKEIHDNGHSSDSKDFSSVTFRRENLYGPFNSLGMPLCILEKSYDTIDGEMMLAGCKELSYTPQGLLLSERVLQENGCVLTFQEWSYDETGKHLHRTEKDKEYFLSYDLRGHLIYEWDCSCNFETFYEYNFDTLLKVEKRYFNQECETTTFYYDSHGNLSKSYDYLGNETHYFYDSRNRKIASTAPAIGECLPNTYFFYDAFNNVTQVIDPKGYKTNTSYNSRGQPLLIQYPDGSQESFFYYLDGGLKEEVKRDKCRIHYEYDVYGNLIKKESFSSDCISMERIEKGYLASSLLFENSSKLGLKQFSYDRYGRIIQIEHCQEQHLSQFGYDTYGNLTEKRELWMQAPGLSQISYFNETTTAICDQFGNRCFEQAKQEKQEPEFEKKISTNALGQKVLEKSYVDSAGCQLIFLCNAYEMPITEIKKDPFGREVYQKHFNYDLLGNKIRESYEANDQEILVTVWTYGPMNRLEETIEAHGTAFQKSHHYSYNALGQLSSVLKPDGISIFYEYDSEGRVLRHYASDSTIDYVFTYDEKGNLVHVLDVINQSACSRIYNEKNKLVEEILANGLSIQNDYDAAGRRIALHFQDGSSVTYNYDTLFLRDVIRKNKQGDTLYSHSFKTYDLQGRLLVASMIGGLGEVHTNADCTSLSSPYHIALHEDNEIILKHPMGIENFNYKQDPSGQITSENGHFEAEYSYDSFGNRSSQVHNVLHQVIADQTSSYGYDLNGNLVQKKTSCDCFEYTYDALNRLTDVFLNGSNIAHYRYDCFHRRIMKQTQQETYYFLYDGLHEIGKTAADGGLLELRILGYGNGETGSSLAIELGDTIYAPLHDLQGSIVGLVNLSSRCLEELYCYSVFGKEKMLLGVSSKNPWRYAGKRFDQETGFSFFGRRYYDPELGRWITPDPAGYTEGPNLYIFAKNDPLHNKDAFGLFSFKSFLHILFHPLEYIDRMMGKLYHYLCGYGIKERNSSVYGHGEVSDKVRVTLINGMLTDEYWVLRAAKALSQSHGGVNIHYVHRPPTNIILDAFRAHMVKKGCISPHARLLADTWKELIHEMGGPESNGLIIHYAHSIGTCETMAALSLMTEEEQNMIKVYTFGSPCLSNKHHYQIHHFVSVRDGICLLDLCNLIKAAQGKNPSVTFVGSFLGIPLMDHLFGTQSYVDIWSAMGKTFVEWYGSLI